MSDSAVYVLKSILFPFCHHTHLWKSGFMLVMEGEGVYILNRMLAKHLYTTLVEGVTIMLNTMLMEHIYGK